MTKVELKQFQTILTARIAELERPVRHREGIAVERRADQLEEIQAAAERTLAVSNLDRHSYQLREARAAVNRIREGNFGICRMCEEDMHPKRLAALPWAPLCIHCQEAMDRNREMQLTDRDLFANAA
jgi:DnaK suppressor protein